MKLFRIAQANGCADNGEAMQVPDAKHMPPKENQSAREPARLRQAT